MGAGQRLASKGRAPGRFFQRVLRLCWRHRAPLRFLRALDSLLQRSLCHLVTLLRCRSGVGTRAYVG